MVEDLEENEENGDGSERRCAPRLGIEAEVRVVGEQPWATTYRTGNLSVTGAFLVTDAPPPRGARLTLDLQVSQDEVVLGVEALVVHIRAEASEPTARGCGVMFVRMSRDGKERLGELVARHSKELAE